MKAVKHTGLVPVKSTKTGAVFGVSPGAALKGVESGEFTLVPIPEGLETIEVGGGTPEAPLTAPAKTVDVDIPEDWEEMHHLQRIKLAMKLAPDFAQEGEETKTEAADRVIRSALAGEGNGGDEPVDIPEDWEEMHHNTRISLAEGIIGGDIELTDEERAADVKASDKADLIILEELEQRAAAGTAQDTPAA